MAKSHRVSAGFFLFVAISAWASAPVFIRGLSAAYDPLTQAFLRYITAAVVLSTVSYVGFRGEFLALLRRPKALLGVGAVNLVLQVCWTYGCYESKATMAQFLSKLSVVFVIAFSFVLFHEERAVIRSAKYLGGTLLSLVGLAILLAKEPGSLRPVFDRGTLMLLLTATLWAVYVVWAKHSVRDVHPIPMFTIVAICTAVGFGALSLGYRHRFPDSPFATDPRTLGLVVASALLPIATAHPAYHYAQKHLGSAFCSTVSLMNPLMTYAIASVFLAQEDLLPRQWGGGCLLILGTLLVTYGRYREHVRSRVAD